MTTATTGVLCILFLVWPLGCAASAPAAKGSAPATRAPVVMPALATDPGPDRSRLPEPGPLVPWSPPEPRVFRLTNGLVVYHLEQQEAPLATLLLVLPRGSATDPPEQAGLTALSVDMLDEGAGSRGALELSDELQTMATDYYASTDIDHVLLGMHLLSDKFSESAALLSDIVRRPKLLPEEFARRKGQRISELLAAEASPTHALEIVLHRALFGKGYAGAPPSGTARTLEAIRLADVRSHYRAFFAPQNAALVVVGNISLETARAALEPAFGDWKGAPTARSANLEAEGPSAGVYLVDYPGATQSAVSVARRAGGEAAPDYFPALVFSRAFGGAFTSRLNLNLREDKGFTYGASSGFRRWKEVGLFRVGAHVKSEVTRETIDEIFAELRRASSDRPISADERGRAVDGLLLGYPGRFEHMGAVARQFALLPLYQRELDWYTRWPARIEAQTTEAINDIARRSGKLDEYVVIVAGDRRTVEPAFQGLPFGVRLFDAQGQPIQN